MVMVRVLIAALCCLTPVGAQSGKPTKQPSSASKDAALSITIKATRKKPTAGSSLDVIVHVRNISSETQYLDEVASTLVFPSDLSTTGSIGRSFVYFGQESPFYSLPAGEETILFCSAGDSPPPPPEDQKGATQKDQKGAPQSNRWQLTIPVWPEIQHFWSFAPGDYEVAALIYHTTDPKGGDAHVATEQITIPMGAPQSVVLFGAGLGGLCAYVLFLRLKPSNIDSLQGQKLSARILRESSRALSAVIFSIVVTILLSRISETQFFIKVTVEDLWGALATGFVASYLGEGLLDRLMLASSTSGRTDESRSSTKDKEKTDSLSMENSQPQSSGVNSAAGNMPHKELDRKFQALSGIGGDGRDRQVLGLDDVQTVKEAQPRLGS
jgi:hypothetical protein